MRLDFNRNLIAIFQEQVLAQAHSSRRSSHNDRSGRKRGALRQKADKLGNSENKVTSFSNFVSSHQLQ
jgi:hypothetical protein